MRRLILLITLALTTYTTMAQSKYPICDDFRAACRITAPIGRGVLGMGNLFLGSMPKGMCSNKELSIERMKIRSSVDGNKIRAWVITPRATNITPRPAILMLHGGGFVFKGAPYHYDLAKEYARRTGAVVVMVDYRTAHNNTYGTTLQDCIDAWWWMMENAAQIGINTSRVAIVGDSAGGFLAIKMALTEGITPSKLMLIYPVVDCSMRTASMAQYDDTPVWNSKLNRKMWEYYLQGNEEQSLLDITEDELRRLPATYIETAEFDCLRDEGDTLATMLESVGIETTHTNIKGTMHGFDMAQRSEITQRQVTARCTWLAK